MLYTKEQLLEKYKKLPQDVQDAIFSVDTSEIIREIGEKHKLMIDKIGELADETGLVMLGLTHPNQFINNLAERLEVEHDMAKEIAEEINSKVFYPIRENLKKIHGVGGEEIEGKEVPPPPEPEIAPAEVPTAPPVPEALPEIPSTPTSEAPFPSIPTKPSEEIIEKETPPLTPPSIEPLEKTEAPPEEVKKIDPYREQIS